MQHDEPLEGRGWSSHVSVWRLVGGAVLALVAYGVITSLPDIKRYLRIRRM
jgi:hypothetical protein